MVERSEEKVDNRVHHNKKIFITSIVSIVLFSIGLALPASAMTVEFDHTVQPDDWYYVGHGAVITIDASVDPQYTDPNQAPANTVQAVNVMISVAGGDSINLPFTETSATSGKFTFPTYVMFTSGPTNQGTPALHVAINNIVTAQVTDATPPVNPLQDSVNIVSNDEGGTWPPNGVFQGDKTVKLTGTDSDSDGIVDSWEKTTGLEIPYNGITYTYSCVSTIAYDCPVVGKKDRSEERRVGKECRL